MRHFHISLVVVLGGVVCLFAADSASATVLLDQQHNVPTSTADSSNGAVSEMAQTFTVGIAGTLDHIDALMFQLGFPFLTNGDPKLSVYNTTAGLPSGAPLVTVQVSKALVPFNNANFVTFDVSGANIPVSVGQVLAFGISTLSDPGPYFWLEDIDNGGPTGYAGGAAFRRTLPNQPWQAFTPSMDHEFMTYVNAVPEPSTFVLGIASLAVLGIVTLRKMFRQA